MKRKRRSIRFMVYRNNKKEWAAREVTADGAWHLVYFGIINPKFLRRGKSYLAVTLPWTILKEATLFLCQNDMSE